MAYNPSQPALDFWISLEPPKDFESFSDVIIDRKSHYTVTYGKVTSKEEIDTFMKNLKKDSYFAKASHNSYAYRLKESSWAILEGKNDDGETGAGMCILRELQRVDFLGWIVIVTRYFGGIHLQADRFKHVINACKILFKKIGE